MHGICVQETDLAKDQLLFHCQQVLAGDHRRMQNAGLLTFGSSRVQEELCRGVRRPVCRARDHRDNRV